MSSADDADRVDLELAALDAIEATEDDVEAPPGTQSLARARRAWARAQVSLLLEDHQRLS